MDLVRNPILDDPHYGHNSVEHEVYSKQPASQAHAR